MNKSNENHGTGSSSHRTKISPFPLEVLPPVLQSFIRKSNEADGMSIDHLAAAILGAASMAIGRTHRVQIEEWIENSGQLCLVLVGNPNAGKSRSLELALSPIYRHDTLRYKEYQQEIASLEPKKGGARKTGPQPGWRKIIVQDSEPKVLSKVNQSNVRGIGLYPHNMVDWLSSLHRGLPRNFWLSVWSESFIDMGSGSRKIYVERPYITVVGAIRPDDITELANRSRFWYMLSNRLLVVWPETNGKPLWTDDELPMELKAQYDAGIQQLLDLAFNESGEPQLIIADAAYCELVGQYLLHDCKAMVGKKEWLQLDLEDHWRHQIARFALLLQLLWWAFEGIEKDQLGEQMAARAIQLAEYFDAHSRKVFAPSVAEVARRLSSPKRKVYKALPAVFSLTEGLRIAERLGMMQRSFQRFLKEEALFLRVAHGEHKKR